MVLSKEYSNKSLLLRSVPELILRYNLHGIDIDPRAAQIGSLALWMRAQRAWQGISRCERPTIRRTNIVIAEPMPGEMDLLNEFCATLEPKLLGTIVRDVFERMKIAGDAGALLRIETDIADLVEQVKRQWLTEEAPTDRQGNPLLFAKSSQRTVFEMERVTSDFWIYAEERVFNALDHFSGSAENDRVFRRRLFADDAQRGFGFIDLCRKQFDVILMNPPFGDATETTYKYLERSLPDAKHDVLASFVSTAQSRLRPDGRLGALTKREPLFTATFEKWRRTSFFGDNRLDVFADLGSGVLDGAMVEVAAYVTGDKKRTSAMSAFSPISSGPANYLQQTEIAECPGFAGWARFLIDYSSLASIPGFPIAYATPLSVLRVFTSFKSLANSSFRTAQGLGTTDDFRFCRLRYEVPMESLVGYSNVADSDRAAWVFYVKGEPTVPYFGDVPVVVNWTGNGREVKEFNRARYGSASRNVKGEALYGRAGLVFPRRTTRFTPRLMPGGCIFSVGGQSIFAPPESLMALLGLLASGAVNELIQPMLGRVSADMAATSSNRRLSDQFEAGLISRIPLPPWEKVPNHLGQVVAQIASMLRKQLSGSETSSAFCAPLISPGLPSFRQAVDEANRALSALRSEYEQLVSLCEKYAAQIYGIQAGNSGLTKAPPLLSEVTEELQALRLVSYSLGLAFGRFSPIEPSESESLFCDRVLDPMSLVAPACVRGVNSRREYPVAGMMVHDHASKWDLYACAKKSFIDWWGTHGEDVWDQLATLIAGPNGDLRSWVNEQFFDRHLRSYSENKRKAPVYWQLSVPSVRYSVWLHYHDMGHDTFYRVLNDFVKPKVLLQERKVASLRAEFGQTPTQAQRKSIHDEEAFVAELTSFRDEIENIAPLWRPNLNDGVLLNFASLWKLIPQLPSWQRELRNTWQELSSGEHDWAHIAMHLWPERVIPKCLVDRSLAIAHGLDNMFWEEQPGGKWQSKRVSAADIKVTIEERTSKAVKAALGRLISEEGTQTQTKRGRRTTGRNA